MAFRNHHPPDGSHNIKPSSVLRSFMHRRTVSEKAPSSSNSSKDPFISSSRHGVNQAISFLPHDHPHHRALGELQQNQQSQTLNPPKKSKEGKRPNTSGEGHKSLHKKTLSSISLKSLTGRDGDKASKSKDETKPKRTKSSTNLSNLLSRTKSSKSLRKEAAEEEARQQKDKENQNPTSPAPTDTPARPPPIYAQFSSECFARQPLGGKFLEDEIDLYTPREYSPGKQRNFYEGPGHAPTLGRRDSGSQRPRSTYLPSNFSIQDISRRISGGSSRRNSAEIIRKVSGARRSSSEREVAAKSEKTGPHRGQRVLAAVSALSAKSKGPAAPEPMQVLEDKDIDREFEAMLDRRNIPEHQRGKMRNLAKSMKRDFIKQDWAEIAAARNGRPGTNGSDSSADATAAHDVPEAKAKRPRSLTFTSFKGSLSRGSSKEPQSPTKKQRPQGTLGNHSRKNSSESVDGGSRSLSMSGAAVAHALVAKAKGQLPEDFVAYLRKVQKPELVEVGRLHKLRLLLRNETVAWTEEFIGHGGMEEIVGLLHRIMEVEWRYVTDGLQLCSSMLTMLQRGARRCLTT